MIELGKVQKLIVLREKEFGVYLGETTEDSGILLPKKQVPEGTAVGSQIEVFVYKDSMDRMIATTKTPKITLGEIAVLTVKERTRIGAFLDWGLEKDLLLPFRQQRGRVEPGDKVLVSLYVDKSSRLCATMNVYENLRSDSPYNKDDKVMGRVYELSDNFGAFVAVDNQYSALIPKKEMYGDIRLGEDIEARVIRVLEDGRLTLSVRDKAYLQIEKDAQAILELLDSYEGSLPFNDKASPEVIKYETGMSKNEFKRAVGNLLKAGKIEITARSIRRIQ